MLLACCCCGQAAAADGGYLLGDWDGGRSRLANSGITFDVGYDTAGFAVGATHANDRAADHQRLYNQLHPDQASRVLDGNEYVAELIYAWRPVPGLTVRPNLQ